MIFKKIATMRYNAIKNDNITFAKWERNEITTQECYDKFCENNHYPCREKVNEDEFVRWLNSLGWNRSLFALEKGVYNAFEPKYQH